LIDLAFGEVADRIHPTLWMGKITDYFKPKLKNENQELKRSSAFNKVSGCNAETETPASSLFSCILGDKYWEKSYIIDFARAFAVNYGFKDFNL